MVVWAFILLIVIVSPAFAAMRLTNSFPSFLKTIISPISNSSIVSMPTLVQPPFVATFEIRVSISTSRFKAILAEPRANIIKAYKEGKGAMKVRAKWEKEDLSHGQYQIVVTEIPYLVQKSDLIMKIAKLLSEKKFSTAPAVLRML